MTLVWLQQATWQWKSIRNLPAGCAPQRRRPQCQHWLKDRSLKQSLLLPCCPVLLPACTHTHRYVAISYDIKQKKPELSIAWSGDTLSEKVS
jgi:hypothetical protein